MNFIALVISLLLERLLGEHTHLRDPKWFHGYSAWLRGVIGHQSSWNGPVGLLLLVGLPTAAVGIVYHLLGGALLSLFALLFSIAVLLFSLGPSDLDAEATSYIEAVEAGDEERAAGIAKTIAGEPMLAQAGRRDRQVAEAVLVQFNERIFAVLLWFVVLGPMGAILYRVTSLARQHGSVEDEGEFASAAVRLQGILDWVPSRLIALGFALAGSFEDAVTDWKAYYERKAEHFWQMNADIIVATGRGALRFGEIGDADDTQGPARVRSALALVLRTLIVWVVLYGLVTIAGFAF